MCLIYPSPSHLKFQQRLEATMTKDPRTPRPRLLGLAMIAGAVSSMHLACGTESVSTLSGQSGSAATNSVGNPTGGSDGLGGTSASDVGGGTNTMSSDCAAGSERCACFGNGTCNSGLVCASQRCVNISGLNPATGGAPASGSGGATSDSGGTQTGGVASGGAISNSLGGVNGTGGSSAGVTGGTVATGGAKSTGGAFGAGGSPPTGGASGASFWKTVTYSSSALPNPSNGNHNPGQNCIQCHTSGNGEAPIWLFGGTVYQANGTTPAAHVQVGVNDGTNLYTAYSATNGNFWFGGTGNINWANAQVRLRNANGELAMAGATPASTCNLCHNGTTYPRITAP